MNHLGFLHGLENFALEGSTSPLRRQGQRSLKSEARVVSRLNEPMSLVRCPNLCEDVLDAFFGSCAKTHGCKESFPLCVRRSPGWSFLGTLVGLSGGSQCQRFFPNGAIPWPTRRSLWPIPLAPWRANSGVAVQGAGECELRNMGLRNEERNVKGRIHILCASF